MRGAEKKRLCTAIVPVDIGVRRIDVRLIRVEWRHVSPVLENLGSLNIHDRCQRGHHAGTELVERTKRRTLLREDRANGTDGSPRWHVHYLGLEENRIAGAIEVARHEKRSARAACGDEWVDRCTVPARAPGQKRRAYQRHPRAACEVAPASASLRPCVRATPIVHHPCDSRMR